jgi:hypothetical protein
MLKLTFGEIKNARLFENLIAAYFRSLKKATQSNIIHVEVKQSGIGVDEGKDILVDFMVTDNITEFKRRWVIQCKFHAANISPQKIADINLPTLIHSYKACGYLLICKTDPTSKLTKMFERLNADCQLNYRYEIWSGEEFIHKLLTADENIRKQFFPIYYKNEERLTKK